MGALEGKRSTGDAPDHPHVLVFPFPLQGHVTPMLKLAEVLSLSGIRVTFVNSDRNHRRLLSSASVRARLARRPGLHLRCIPEDFSEDNPRIRSGQAAQMIREFDAAAQLRLREILSSGGVDADGAPPVTCVVADALIRLAVDVAEDLGVPIIGFRTSSACSYWTDQCIPDLIATGALTFRDGCNLDELLGRLPGTESFLRWRDVPSLCRVVDTADDPEMQLLREMMQNAARYQGVIFNTAEFAEPTVLAHILGVVSSVYPIGPLHALLQTVEHLKGAAGDDDDAVVDGVPSSNSTSLLQEDRACMEWLDAKPPASVVYVSFGSIALLRKEQLLELWHGLVNSGYHFLWVVRPGLVADVVGAAEVEDGEAEGRGCRVEWAPQEEVLAHPAVGCFLTHSGWNSTMEGLWAGVPMACWPNLADQYMNRRMVVDLWKTGVEIEEGAGCDRAAVEKAVREAMGGERAPELRAAAASMSKMARECVREDGSSFMNLETLIRDIRAMISSSRSPRASLI